MINKIILSGLLFLCIITTVKAQKAEIKDDKILIEGKEVLKCKKVGPSEYSFYTLNDDEFLSFRYNSDDPPRHPMGEYFILNFLIAKKKIESRLKTHVASGMGMNAKKNMQKIIDWLLEEKVLNKEGIVDSAKLDIFYEKYNENISSKG